MDNGSNGPISRVADVCEDSDADENPFEHDSEQGDSSQNPANSFLSARADDAHSQLDPITAVPPGSSASMITMPATSFSQDRLRVFPSRGPAPLNFPTISGSSGGMTNAAHLYGTALHGVQQGASLTSVAQVDMEDTEVETETEGETENEDSGSEYGGHIRSAAAAAAATTATAAAAAAAVAGGAAAGTEAGLAETATTAVRLNTDWSTNDEDDWVALIDSHLENARSGHADAHAMRQLLRKAGFIPASRRKDVWRLLILGRVNACAHGSGEDILALDAAILSTELDLDNQRVVRVDVDRTRPALEQFKRPRVKNMLARVLTHHCKTNGLGYKQGMHEVLAPFVALSDPELSTSDISLCYGAFIKRFLPYAFNKDEEFLSLQICFRLFRLLLLYHHPRLCRFLDQYQLQPELYATPWFLTLFSNNLDLERLYEVWDVYLYWGDPALHHFVVLAFVIGNADVILQAEEANLPETMCRLSVGMRSVEELRALLRTAKDLMLNTPKSFRKILRSALYANLSQSQMNLVLNTLQVSSCIPVSAEEVISYILHKNPHRQLDQESDADSAPEDGIGAGGHEKGSRVLASPPRSGARGGVGGHSGGSASPQRVAERAAMRSLRGHRQYIIVDCRPRQAFDACRLAPALHLNPDLLVSPDDLDAKLKEFMPLQGVAHFCLVGAGGEPRGVGQRKNTAPSDLSGEAMGLRPTSKGDSPGGTAALIEINGKGDRTSDGSLSAKSDAAVSRDNKDGGFNWMGGFSRALSRGQASPGEREGEEIGREEDVQVARFVLMLLQYNFPYISHVRGDIDACLEELSAQALDERQGEDAADGHFHEALHGVLIGADADRVREQVTRCGPEKKTEGLFAGLAKWSKEKGDSVNGLSIGAEASETRGRMPSWNGRAHEAADRVDGSTIPKTNADVVASRGKGGIGRRDAKDLFPEDSLHQGGQGAGKNKEPKRRLFGGVSNRFDKSDAHARGGAGGGGGGKAESGSGGGGGTRPWRTSSRMRGSKAEAALLQGAGLSASPTSPEASGGESREEGSGKATGTWVKPQKGGPTPDRFARFLGKMLGVRDDALPNSTESSNSGGGGSVGGSVGGSSGVGEEIAGAGTDASPGLREVSARTRSPNAAASNQSLQGVSATQGGATEPGASNDARGEQQQQSASLPVSAGGAQAGGDTAAAGSVGATAARSATAAAPSAESEPVTATAVYPATTISTATADAMPVAVAVAFPVSEGTATAMESDPASSGRRPSRTGAASGSEPAASARRPSRTSRTHRTTPAAAASARTESESPAMGLGESVSISDWIDREQRESGGLVRVFSAQRVLGSKVQKKCRLAVSPKTMTQFNDVREDRATGVARGVITEHRGLRHLSRITSRKKHADLIVFHFKSRSGSGSAAPGAAPGARTAAAAAAGGATSSHGASSSTSRRSRTKPSAEREPATGQPDVLFYFMRDHAECLRMVKENYRKVTQGSGGGGSSSRPAAAATSGSTSSLSVRRGAGGGGGGRGDSSRTTGDHNRKSTRQTARAAAGAAAGAAGIVVGAAAGMAVGAAAGVAVGAAFLAGHRKGSHGEDKKTKSNSPSRFRKRGGSEGPGGTLADADLVNNGWIPIDAPRGERRRADASGGGGGGSGSGVVRPASAGGAVSSRRPSSTSIASNDSRSREAADRGVRGHGRSRGAGSADSTIVDRTATGGPRWLGQA